MEAKFFYRKSLAGSHQEPELHVLYLQIYAKDGARECLVMIRLEVKHVRGNHGFMAAYWRRIGSFRIVESSNDSRYLSGLAADFDCRPA